jgi:hypothetical protein
VLAGSPGGLADFDGCKRGRSSMTVAVACGLRDILLFMVAQQFAGGLVDEMDPGTRRAVDGFIAIRMIRRLGIRDENLNIHAGPRAAKYQFSHFAF